MELGKTTTIKIILGLYKINSGQVLINGYDIKKDFKKAIEKVGAIIESPEGYMYLSGYQNLKLSADLYDNIGEKRIDEVVKLVGLQNRIHDKLSKYSLGMKQRLGIAKAILHRPNVLILDEPTNGLDPEGIKDLRDLLKRLVKEEKMAVLVSSHNLSELESFCTRVCIIQNGKVVEEIEMNNIKNMETIPKYIIEVSDVKDIKQSITDKEIEILEDNKIRVSLSPKEVYEFLTILKSNGIDVYEIKKEEVSLEDAFLKRTGGNEIV